MSNAVKYELLDLFKVMVVAEKDGRTNLDWAPYGLLLDFVPNAGQSVALKTHYEPLNVRTLFTREERENSDSFELIQKQVLHYLEIYGLGTPGLFDLEMENGKLIKMTTVRGVTVDELGDMVRELLYRNAPISDVVSLKDIIKEYSITYDVNKIANNEARVALFDPKTDTFDNGDDLVRYVCYLATGNFLMIKSKEMIRDVSAIAHAVPVSLLERHELQLAQVFNRHKKIIMALKEYGNKQVVNRVSRLSKKNHVPLHESINKSYVAKALAGTVTSDVLQKVSIRDKMKFLNLLAYKRMQSKVDAFVIRNGKIHLEANRKVWPLEDIDRVERDVIQSLRSDLMHLRGKNILLDGNVAYGLPTSRKQAVGNLPFGTRVKTNTDRICAGIYWENDWGARDLDLSTVDTSGNRVGWGQYSGYKKSSPIVFSGDVTYADPNAMEFMTSKDVKYGLFANIFNGQVGCSMSIVVGDDSNHTSWIDEVLIQEKTTLNSRGMVVGFVDDNEFIVWQGRIGNSHVSGGGYSPYVNRGLADSWTINRLLDVLDIKFDVDKKDKTVYDYDMNYANFSYDKLESMLEGYRA